MADGQKSQLLNESQLRALLTLSEQAPQLAEQDIITLGLEEAVRLTQSQIGYCHFVNEDQRTLRLFAWSRETIRICTAAPENHYPLEMAGVWADCARWRQPVIHNDYQNLPNKHGYPQGHSHLIRHMSAPVIEQDKVRMIIGVGNKPNDYDVTDSEQLSLLAYHLWRIVCRRRAEMRIQRLNRFYATLSQINKALARIQERGRLLRELQRIANESELFTAVWIGLLDAKTDRIDVVAGDLDATLGMPCPALAITECRVISEALRRGAPVICNDLQEKKSARVCWEAARRADIRTSVTLPILEQGQVVGVFVAYASEVDFFDEALVNLLWEMVNDISCGLDTLQAEQQIRDTVVRLNRAMLSTIDIVALMSERRDLDTAAGHEQRVGDLTTALGVEMGLNEEIIQGLRIIGRVHDIGKITIPDAILSKPGRLSRLEFEMIKTHVRQGYEILRHADFPWQVAEVILQHHERLDGSGYPQGLRGEQISLEARIVAVADVVEAMTSHRPHRPGLGIEAALAEITEFSGVRYDPQVVAACLRLFRERGYVLRPHRVDAPMQSSHTVSE
ncbi:MAG: GAF domain-containing protein [Gammaproteobacteria bacterium]|nr:GAF domain-containing protein [Gammaproteobacteria bacterium]